jgi:hypothetical protein
LPANLAAAAVMRSFPWQPYSWSGLDFQQG